MQRWVVLGAWSDASPTDTWGLPHGTSSTPPGTAAGCAPGQRLLLSNEVGGEGAFYFCDCDFLNTDLVSYFVTL